MVIIRVVVSVHYSFLARALPFLFLPGTKRCAALRLLLISWVLVIGLSLVGILLGYLRENVCGICSIGNCFD